MFAARAEVSATAASTYGSVVSAAAAAAEPETLPLKQHQGKLQLSQAFDNRTTS